MNKLTFSHDYNKLKTDMFTTIRRYDKPYYQVGEDIEIKSPSEEFVATIILKIKLGINEIPDIFLMVDTEKPTIDKAHELLNSFYKKPIQPEEILTILVIKRWLIS
jgi:hypothetical protein